MVEREEKNRTKKWNGQKDGDKEPMCDLQGDEMMITVKEVTYNNPTRRSDEQQSRKSEVEG